jgi:diadenosine tetraphosphatase ApaH/serine/threonine PP2A family protein phosphatase
VADFQILHGSPLDEDEYLLHAKEAGNLMGYLETKVSFFGHTHVQGGFELLRGGVRNIRPFGYGGDREELQVDLDSYYLINPGSVGQPRDRDPRAAWVVYEPKERLLIFRRVSYEIQETQRKIVDAGLPDILARRLRTGQ